MELQTKFTHLHWEILFLIAGNKFELLWNVSTPVYYTEGLLLVQINWWYFYVRPQKRRKYFDYAESEVKKKGIVFTSPRTAREKIMMTGTLSMSADEILFMTWDHSFIAHRNVVCRKSNSIGKHYGDSDKIVNCCQTVVKQHCVDWVKTFGCSVLLWLPSDKSEWLWVLWIVEQALSKSRQQNFYR